MNVTNISNNDLALHLIEGWPVLDDGATDVQIAYVGQERGIFAGALARPALCVNLFARARE